MAFRKLDFRTPDGALCFYATAVLAAYLAAALSSLSAASATAGHGADAPPRATVLQTVPQAVPATPGAAAAAQPAVVATADGGVACDAAGMHAQYVETLAIEAGLPEAPAPCLHRNTSVEAGRRWAQAAGWPGSPTALWVGDAAAPTSSAAARATLF